MREGYQDISEQLVSLHTRIDKLLEENVALTGAVRALLDRSEVSEQDLKTFAIRAAQSTGRAISDDNAKSMIGPLIDAMIEDRTSYTRA